MPKEAEVPHQEPMVVLALQIIQLIRDHYPHRATEVIPADHQEAEVEAADQLHLDHPGQDQVPHLVRERIDAIGTQMLTLKSMWLVYTDAPGRMISRTPSLSMVVLSR